MNLKDKRKIVSKEILAMWLYDVLHIAFREQFHALLSNALAPLQKVKM